MLGQVFVPQHQLRGAAFENEAADFGVIAQSNDRGFVFRNDDFRWREDLFEQLGAGVFASDTREIWTKRASRTVADVAARALPHAEKEVPATRAVAGQRKNGFRIEIGAQSLPALVRGKQPLKQIANERVRLSLRGRSDFVSERGLGSFGKQR